MTNKIKEGDVVLVEYVDGELFGMITAVDYVNRLTFDVLFSDKGNFFKDTFGYPQIGKIVKLTSRNVSNKFKDFLAGDDLI